MNTKGRPFLLAISLNASLAAAHCLAQTSAVSKDERMVNPDGSTSTRQLQTGDFVMMYGRGLKRVDMTASTEQGVETNTAAIGLRNSSGTTPAVAEFVTSPGSALPPDVASSFPGGVLVSRGIGLMRGWRPMIRTPRTTTVAPGSCLAVEVIVDNPSTKDDEGVERIALLKSDTLSDPAITGAERDKHLTTCWLDSDNTKVAKLDINQFVEVRLNKTSGDWDFLRDYAGNVIVFTLGESDREKFEALVPRIDCTGAVLR